MISKSFLVIFFFVQLCGFQISTISKKKLNVKRTMNIISPFNRHLHRKINFKNKEEI